MLEKLKNKKTDADKANGEAGQSLESILSPKQIILGICCEMYKHADFDKIRDLEKALDFRFEPDNETVNGLRNRYLITMETRFHSKKLSIIRDRLALDEQDVYEEKTTRDFLVDLTKGHPYWAGPNFGYILGVIKEEFPNFPFRKFAQEQYPEWMKAEDQVKYALMYKLTTEINPELSDDFVQERYRDYINDYKANESTIFNLKVAVCFTEKTINEENLRYGIKKWTDRNVPVKLVKELACFDEYKPEDPQTFSKMWDYMPMEDEHHHWKRPRYVSWED